MSGRPTRKATSPRLPASASFSRKLRPTAISSLRRSARCTRRCSPATARPLDSLPDYVPSKEAPETNPELAQKYPLNIIAPKSHGFLNSCYANMDNKIKRQGEQFVMISEADAGARGISEGDHVRVFNDRGAFEVVAKVTDDVGPGLVVSSLGYWRQLNNGTANVVSSADFADMGHAPRVFDSLVQVERVA